MITVRPSQERGNVKLGWLDSNHTFSFGHYYDPEHMGFRALRVINEDWVKGGKGFPTHPHRDMEILTYILSGALSHRDSMGNTATIQKNEVQRITAGTGITHSEFNASETESVHLLQIWIVPDRNNHTPGYEEQVFSEAERRGAWRLVASHTGREQSVQINQDVDLYATLLASGEASSFSLRPGRYAWVQVAAGKLSLNGVSLEAGDGVAISDETQLDLQAYSHTEVLLFDLA